MSLSEKITESSSLLCMVFTGWKMEKSTIKNLEGIKTKWKEPFSNLIYNPLTGKSLVILTWDAHDLVDFI